MYFARPVAVHHPSVICVWQPLPAHGFRAWRRTARRCAACNPVVYQNRVCSLRQLVAAQVHLVHPLASFLLVCARRACVLAVQRRRCSTLRQHSVSGLLMLALLLDTILVRVVLSLLLELEAFLAATADLLGALLLILQL